jgi:hypothetical protein
MQSNEIVTPRRHDEYPAKPDPSEGAALSS